MSEPGNHPMTNGKAEKVSDGLPNGVDSHDLDSVQLDKWDFGPLGAQIHDQVHHLQESRSLGDSALAKLAEIFNGHAEMIKIVDDRYNTGQALEMENSELEKENKMLWAKLDKIKQSHNVQLRNEKREYEKEIARLETKAGSGQRLKDMYENLLEKHKKDHEKLVQDAQEALELKKDQLEKDNQERISKLEADKKSLEEKLAKREQELQDMTQLRDQERQTRETMQSKATAELEKIQQSLASVKAKYEVKRLPVEHYAERYRDLIDSVASTVDDYFSDLPDKAIELLIQNRTGTYGQLKRKRSTFAVVPVTPTETARVLRLANVQNLIFDAIRETVWQPFFSRYLWKTKKDTHAIDEIYWNLAAEGEEIQHDWKVSTLRVLDRLDNGVDVEEKITAAIDQQVVQILEPLLSESNKADFRSELKKVFIKAAELGQESRRDRCPVYIDSSPSANSSSGWKEFSEGFDVEDAPDPTLASCRDNIYSALCVSPRVYRKRETTATPGAGQEEDELVHAGVALFPGTGIFQKGKMEWDEFVLRERERWNVGRTRRASVASNATGPGLSPPELSIKHSKTWGSHLKAEYD
ncbi:hypothetical protein Z517_02274 [Fonsecaea pedrosoi CBS 271.37]|uniref:Uncharacterized protein n=1 Tax=Fonsecaea pedrosoi CBS 271.37 TaxID=1442368 RepID=A0A0D2DZ54_9EURO|nr:uncharacterized protein Z517_02274 [Fonsecaea pedrosoi CBS 271.37]KIW83031.1 hypothetical protein Z517_02274 [Fonsecaea pedrosoi CBS 271.37]